MTAALPFRLRAEVTKIEALLRQDVIEPSDSEALQALIEGESEITELASLIIEQINEDSGLIDGIKQAEARLKARHQRIEQRVERNRDMLFMLAKRLNAKSLQTPVGTFGRSTRSREVYDETKIPTEFFKHPPPVLDKKSILAALKDGPVEGVTEESYETLYLKV